MLFTQLQALGAILCFCLLFYATVCYFMKNMCLFRSTDMNKKRFHLIIFIFHAQYGSCNLNKQTEWIKIKLNELIPQNFLHKSTEYSILSHIINWDELSGSDSHLKLNKLLEIMGKLGQQISWTVWVYKRWLIFYDTDLNVFVKENINF